MSSSSYSVGSSCRCGRPQPCPCPKPHPCCAWLCAWWKWFVIGFIFALAFIAFVISIVALTSLLRPQNAFIYDTTNQTVASGDSVTFNHNGILTGGILHTPGAAAITLRECGNYTVDYFVNAVGGPYRFTLFLNGVAVPGTSYGSGIGDGPLTALSAFKVSATNSVLTLRNAGSSPAVFLDNTLDIGAGAKQIVSASILIHKLI